MAWVVVDKHSQELIFYSKPERATDIWVNMNIDYPVRLPKGSIEKLIGKKLAWEDEPVELKESINKIKEENVNLASKTGNCEICGKVAETRIYGKWWCDKCRVEVI